MQRLPEDRADGRRPVFVYRNYYNCRFLEDHGEKESRAPQI